MDFSTILVVLHSKGMILVTNQSRFVRCIVHISLMECTSKGDMDSYCTSNNSTLRSSLQYESDNVHSSSRSSGDGSSCDDTAALMMGLHIREEGLHSDYTVPTSNLRRYIRDRFASNSDDSRLSELLGGSLSPPINIMVQNVTRSDPPQRERRGDAKHENTLSDVHADQGLDLNSPSLLNELAQQRRRPIFNSATQRKYCGRYGSLQQYSQIPTEDEKVNISIWDGNVPPQHTLSESSRRRGSSSSTISNTSFHIPMYTALSNGTLAPVEANAGLAPAEEAFPFLMFPGEEPFHNPSPPSVSIPPSSHSHDHSASGQWKCCCLQLGTRTMSPHRRRRQQFLSSVYEPEGVEVMLVSNENNSKKHPDTRHAQALVLGCAFAAVWSGCNVTAPNLTSMANDYGFWTEASRDWYLGSVLAIVQTIASLPIAAAVGLLTDVVPSRQKLFVAILIAGALSSALGAISSSSYPLLVLSRWLSGGCMAASVPVAFSLLSDWFDATERNIASSGLTAMMGVGIVGGQVYAGISTKSGKSDSSDWTRAFVASALVQVIFAIFCMYMVHDPIRGGREVALQALMEKHGTAAYDRPLTWSTLRHAIWNNASNTILLWQGFFSSIPWGVMFVFLNDYLSQERGFTVPDATFLVAVFGIGCAAGGIIGGYIGQVIMHRYNRSLLPLFMAISTLIGIVPFLWLLNSSFSNARGIEGISLAAMGGFIASVPSVLVRPCILNVNPPESRGAAMTTSNLLVQLGRGVGPSCLTLIQTFGNYFLASHQEFGDFIGTFVTVPVDRKFAFNVTLIVFWVISALQLLFLMKTLPHDQDAMEADLASYASLKSMALTKHMSQDAGTPPRLLTSSFDNGGSSAVMDSPTRRKALLPLLVSIQERINYFDNVAAQQTLQYVRAGIQEIQFSPFHCHIDSGDNGPLSSPSNEGNEESANTRRALWYDQETMIPPTSGSNFNAYGGHLDDPYWTDETLLSHPPAPPFISGSSNDSDIQRQMTEATPLFTKDRGH
jgi:MFS family permease